MVLQRTDIVTSVGYDNLLDKQSGFLVGGIVQISKDLDALCITPAGRRHVDKLGEQIELRQRPQDSSSLVKYKSHEVDIGSLDRLGLKEVVMLQDDLLFRYSRWITFCPERLCALEYRLRQFLNDGFGVFGGQWKDDCHSRTDSSAHINNGGVLW